MLRAVLDVNILISYLLTPFSGGAAVEVVNRGWNEEFTMLISDPLVEELRGVVATSEYISERVDPVSLNRFVREFALLAEHVELIGKRVWPWLRDAEDAFLLEMAVAGEADYLVSGDKGVLAVAGTLPGTDVVTPVRFLDVLDGTR